MNFAKQLKVNKRVDENILSQTQSDEIRLNKYISDSGVASRRQADEMVNFGRIKINGIVAQTGMKVKTGDVVTLDNKVIAPLSKKVYIALNKPRGIISTTDTSKIGNLITFMNYPEKIFMIGRLDKDSSGLLLLTNDGDIVNKILRAENGHDKKYIVTVSKKITASFVENMQKGVLIYNPVQHQDQLTLPTKVRVIDDFTFEITLNQGLNRQIRRMVDALDNHVETLKRISVMHITLDGLEEGYWRYFTEQELIKLNELINE